MSKNNKDQAAILSKLGIASLNEMQLEAQEAIATQPEVVLISPTGTGKTLAFLLPILDILDPQLEQVQALILVPSRELAIQIEQVAREMGSGFKVNAVYGGRAVAKDKIDLQHPPAILIGTPGRIADHLKRKTIGTRSIKTIVLDEFDKSLETGFEKEMKAIVAALPALEKKILTSATQQVGIPHFVGIQQPTWILFDQEGPNKLKLNTVISPAKDKLQTLAQLLSQVGTGRGIIFCNFKDTIQFVSNFLQQQKFPHTCFFGGMEQQDRERSLIKFRNGTHRILLATDLAARGIDVPELDFIIHYQMPLKQEEFTHRNGRTARMHSDGTAYLLKFKDADLPDYVENAETITLSSTSIPTPSKWKTLFVSGGRKDKISKGDIAGFFLKQGGLQKDELGLIELKQDCAFVAVPKGKVRQVVKQLNNGRVKKRKVRVVVLED